MTLKDFRVHRLIGRGGYGAVYHATRTMDGLGYALKVLNISKMSQQERQRTLNEIRFLASIKHPFIISYYESFIESSKLFIVMEFAPKGDLHARVKKRRSIKPVRKYSEDLVWAVLIQIALGLKCLHDLNIIHRDIKSSNIFITDEHRVKIGDFGVAKLIETEFTKTMIGTPYYQSPEIWVQTPYTTKIDIWSFGCVMYEMATFQYPYNAQDYKSLGKKVLQGSRRPIPESYSTELADVIDFMMCPDPNERPSIDQILELEPVKSKFRMIPGIDQIMELNFSLEDTLTVPPDMNEANDFVFPRNAYPSHKDLNPGLDLYESPGHAGDSSSSGFSDTESQDSEDGQQMQAEQHLPAVGSKGAPPGRPQNPIGATESPQPHSHSRQPSSQQQQQQQHQQQPHPPVFPPINQNQARKDRVKEIASSNATASSTPNSTNSVLAMQHRVSRLGPHPPQGSKMKHGNPRNSYSDRAGSSPSHIGAPFQDSSGDVPKTKFPTDPENVRFPALNHRPQAPGNSGRLIEKAYGVGVRSTWRTHPKARKQGN